MRGGHVREGGPGPLHHYRLGEGRWGAGRVEAGGGSVLTQASCGGGVGPGAAGRRAVSNTAPPRMRCHWGGRGYRSGLGVAMGSCGHWGEQSWGSGPSASLCLSFPAVQLSGCPEVRTYWQTNGGPPHRHPIQGGRAWHPHPRWPPPSPALALWDGPSALSAPRSSHPPQPGSTSRVPLQLQTSLLHTNTHSPASLKCPFAKPLASQHPPSLFPIFPFH